MREASAPQFSIHNCYSISVECLGLRNSQRADCEECEVSTTIEPAALTGDSRLHAWYSSGATITQFLLPILAVATGAFLVAMPIFGTLLRGFMITDADPAAFTASNYVRLFTDPTAGTAAFNTVLAGICVMLFSCIIGCSLAWVVGRTNVPFRKVFGILNLVPFFFSPYVGAMSWLYILAPNGGILQKLSKTYLGHEIPFINIYNVGGVIWVLSLFYAPYIYLFVIGPIRNMDGALEDAGRVHGASFWYTFRHITLPMLLPSILSGMLIVLVTSAGLFDVPLSIAEPHGIKMIPTEIYRASQYPSDFGRAAVLGTIMMLITILISLAQQNYIRGRRFYTVTGKGYRPRPIELGRFGRMLALSTELIFILMSSVLPLSALVMVSLSPIWTGTFRPSFVTLQNYNYVLFHYRITQSAIFNSAYLATVGASISLALGCLQAYFIRRRTSWISHIVEPILSLPLGIPGIIIGLGFLILLIGTPLYATIWIMIVATVAHFFPIALRSIAATLLSLNPELEECARSSGANWFQMMRYILIPLLRPALAATWLLLFVILIRELGASLLLYNQGTETVSVVLVLLSEQNFGYVAALAVTQVVVLITAFFLMQRNGISFLEN